MLIQHTLERPRNLIECDTVLDVGAGLRPMCWYRPRRHLCVEPFGPYADVLRTAGYEVLQETAADALASVRVADAAIYLLDVIEHMERGVGRRVLDLALAATPAQIVVFTPWGFEEQTGDAWEMGGEYWQTHRSGWTPEDFPGWQITARLDGAHRGFVAMWTAK
jgi:hypothetical protein